MSPIGWSTVCMSDIWGPLIAPGALGTTLVRILSFTPVPPRDAMVGDVSLPKSLILLVFFLGVGVLLLVRVGVIIGDGVLEPPMALLFSMSIISLIASPSSAFISPNF